MPAKPPDPSSHIPRWSPGMQTSRFTQQRCAHAGKEHFKCCYANASGIMVHKPVKHRWLLRCERWPMFQSCLESICEPCPYDRTAVACRIRFHDLQSPEAVELSSSMMRLRTDNTYPKRQALNPKHEALKKYYLKHPGGAVKARNLDHDGPPPHFPNIAGVCVPTLWPWSHLEILNSSLETHAE